MTNRGTGNKDKKYLNEACRTGYQQYGPAFGARRAQHHRSARRDAQVPQQPAGGPSRGCDAHFGVLCVLRPAILFLFRVIPICAFGGYPGGFNTVNRSCMCIFWSFDLKMEEGAGWV